MKHLMLAAAVAMALSPAAAFAQGTTAGNYTIDVRSEGDQILGQGQNPTANRNTDPAATQRTIDANPGLAEKLAEEGVKTSEIGALSVEPNGRVVVYKK